MIEIAIDASGTVEVLAAGAVEMLAAGAVKMLDAVGTVVMFDRRLISLGKAYLFSRRLLTCFAKVSTWAHIQKQLAISCQS